MRWKKTGEEGLLTVEAILGLVPFILVILGIISFIDIFAVHKNMYTLRFHFPSDAWHTGSYYEPQKYQ